jgi:hypothetical protein
MFAQIAHFHQPPAALIFRATRELGSVLPLHAGRRVDASVAHATSTDSRAKAPNPMWVCL